MRRQLPRRICLPARRDRVPRRRPSRRDPDDLTAHERDRGVDIGEGHGGAADLEAPHRPRVRRHEVVDHQGDLGVGLYVAELPGGAHGVPADDDVAGLLVEEDADRIVLGGTVGIDRGEPAERLALQVGPLGVGQGDPGGHRPSVGGFPAEEPESRPRGVPARGVEACPRLPGGAAPGVPTGHSSGGRPRAIPTLFEPRADDLREEDRLGSEARARRRTVRRHRSAGRCAGRAPGRSGTAPSRRRSPAGDSPRRSSIEQVPRCRRRPTASSPCRPHRPRRGRRRRAGIPRRTGAGRLGGRPLSKSSAARSALTRTQSTASMDSSMTTGMRHPVSTTPRNGGRWDDVVDRSRPSPSSPGGAGGGLAYWRAIATDRRSSGRIRCDGSSMPWSSCTQFTVPPNRLVSGV